jgi:hypothetical protein
MSKKLKKSKEKNPACPGKQRKNNRKKVDRHGISHIYPHYNKLLKILSTNLAKK